MPGKRLAALGGACLVAALAGGCGPAPVMVDHAELAPPDRVLAPHIAPLGPLLDQIDAPSAAAGRGLPSLEQDTARADGLRRRAAGLRAPASAPQMDGDMQERLRRLRQRDQG